MKLTTIRVLLASCAVMLTLATSSWAAGAAPRPDVVHASVAPGSQTDPHGGYYVLKAKPGATITQQVVISNPNDHTVIANIGGVDSWTSDATGASYGTPGSTPKSTGTWIALVTPQLQLAAHQSRTIPFTVTVPSGLQPGQYLGGVSIWVPAAKPPTTVPSGSNKAGFVLTLQTQRVIAVEVDIPGPRAPHLVVRSVQPVVHADALRLQFDVANTGNAFAKGHGTLSVADTNTRQDFKIETFVPHTAIKLAIAWTKNVVPGVHQVTLRLQDQTGRVVTWTGSADVSGAVGASLERTLAGAKGAKIHHSSSSSPWKWLGLIVVPIFIALAIHLRRRRSALAPSEPQAGRAASGGVTRTPPRSNTEARGPGEAAERKAERTGASH